MHAVREFAGHADIRTTEVDFVRKEEDAEVAARRIPIRLTGRRGEWAREAVAPMIASTPNPAVPDWSHSGRVVEGSMGRKRAPAEPVPAAIDDDAYAAILAGVTALLEAARHVAARAVNSLMTATYWEIGRRIVEEEQRGRARAAYGERLIERLAEDLTARFGRGFSKVNPETDAEILQGMERPPDWSDSV